MNHQSSDSELMDKLRKGDLLAFDLVFKKYGDRLFGFALKYLKSKEEAEGLVQNTFLKIWENRKNLKTESSLKSYLFTIAYHDMCRFFRKKQIHEKYEQEIGVNGNKSIEISEQLDYRILLQKVDQLIEKLPEKQKIIFIKSRKECKSTREIAEEMNLAPGTIDNQISAAIKFLRKRVLDKNLALLLFLVLFV